MIPKISIIVPIYNVEQYLHKCINSILGQTFTDFELILVDDGSPDNCPNICDEYARKDTRIRVIHKENGGISDARNAGIEAAIGEYLLFIDSDDFISTNLLEFSFYCAEENNADLVCFRYQSFYDEIKVVENKSSTPLSIKILEGNKKIKTYTDNIHRYVNAWTKLYNRKLFDNLRFPKGQIFEDAFIMHEIFNSADRIVMSNQILYFYRLSENSITRSKFTIKKFDELTSFSALLSYLIKNDYEEYINKPISLSIDQLYRYFEIVLKEGNSDYYNCWVKHRNVIVNNVRFKSINDKVGLLLKAQIVLLKVNPKMGAYINYVVRRSKNVKFKINTIIFKLISQNLLTKIRRMV